MSKSTLTFVADNQGYREGKLGKRASLLCQMVLLVGAISSGLLARSESPREPVLVYLQAEMTDHVNLDVTEDRLRHLLPMLEKYRKDHPEAHVCATVMFSGAVSDALAQRNSETHIVDFVKDYIRRGVIEVGYDGADEPTYKNRPTLDFSNAKSIDDRWMVRAQTEERILTEARDPLTGVPQAGKDGGLKRMQEVFGDAVYISGVEPMLDNSPRPAGGATATNESSRAYTPADARVKHPVPTFIPEIGGDSESVRQIRNYNNHAIMPGLPEDNRAELPGFGGAEEGFLRLIAPTPQRSPEVYWQDNVLRLSEVSNTSEAAEEADHDYEGLTAKELKEDTGDLNRSRIQVVRVELADERNYLQHAFTKEDEYALKYAYGHPNSPKLPAEARLAPADVDAAYAKEAAALEWLAGEFFTANPGSRFVSSTDLRKVAALSAGYSVSMQGLRTALTDLLAAWGNDTFPPSFLTVDGHYLSLADTFQVMTDALTELDRTGKLPQSVSVVPVYGPLYTPTGHGPNVGEVTAAAVAHTAAGIAARLHDTSAGPVPKNSIPAVVAVPISAPANGNSDGQAEIKMSAAQFLRLMASALVAPSPDTKLRVKMTYMFPVQASLMPKTRTTGEMGASWTVKPAQLELGNASQSAQAQK